MSADAQARTATVGDITLLVCTQFSSPCILLRQRRREKKSFSATKLGFELMRTFHNGASKMGE
jgi:hypothetical protein